MNFDTKIILDILYLDDALVKEIEDMILEERSLWDRLGKVSNNDFVKSIVPLIKDSIRIGILKSLNSLRLSHISKYINYNNVDYFQLIPIIAKI